MIGRIATWLFYAVFFFLVGVWASPRMPTLDGVVASVFDLGYRGVLTIQEWALASTPEDPAKEAPAAPAAPANPAPAVPAPANPAPAVPAPLPAAADLSAARAAFAGGDITGAIAAYEEFLRGHADDLDARGELGNVLYAAQRFAEAARVYFDTAVALIARGDVARARALEPAIRRGDAALADDLLKRLGAPTNASAPAMPAGQSAVSATVQ